VLPSLDLPIEKGAPCRVIRERSQVAIEPREETPCPVGGLPGAAIGNARVAINRMVMAAPDLPVRTLPAASCRRRPLERLKMLARG